MARRRALIAMAAVAVIAAGIVVVVLVGRGASSAGAPARGSDARSAARGRAPALASSGAAQGDLAASAELAAPAELPGSLEGTEADGAVTADAAGRLVISLELRRLFDHFLAATGEEPLATMRARIVAVLRARLPAGAVAEATEILDRYLAYREAARALGPTASDRDGLTQVHELRARMFAPAVAQAFFADEEAATFAALARRDAMADPTLSDAERARRIAELEARIPAEVREGRAAAMVPLDEMNREAELRAAGASQAQITASRTAAFGADGAARLAELDRARAAWNDRLARFRAAKAALLADPRLDAAARQAQVEALLAQSFTPAERIRVAALEQLPAGR